MKPLANSESARNALRFPPYNNALRRLSLSRSYRFRLLHTIMTASPPKHQLWHPSRGISFSPLPPSPKSSIRDVRAFTGASVSANQERNVALHNSPISPPPWSKKAEGQAPSLPAEDVITSVSPKSDVDAGPRAEDGQAESAAENTSENKPEKPDPFSQPPPSVLDFKIVEDLFHAAKRAPDDTRESFWSYSMYRGTGEDGAERRVKIHYCRNKHAMENVCRQYFMDEEVLGFDLEWVADAMKWQGLRKNVSLIQLASPSRIALFHVALFAKDDDMVGPSFRSIMEDTGITKVGVAIKGDTTRLRNFLGIDSKGLMELSHLYKLVTYSSKGEYKNINKRLVTLASQVKEYLHLPLFKGSDVRSSDWTKVLDFDQISYSASDAYAGLHLYATLEYHRKQLDPCPPTPHFAERNIPIRLAEGVELAVNEDIVEAVDELATPAQQAPLSVEVLSSLLEDISIEDQPATSTTNATDANTTDATETAPLASTQSKPAAAPKKAKDSRVEISEDRASNYRSTHPKCRATFAQLRAYYMWHHHDLRPAVIARLLRDPPLQTNTIVGYILTAVQLERLPVDSDRLREEVTSGLSDGMLLSRWPAVGKLVVGDAS
ncbi:ribonuclease H-like protein [Xylariomycetidae sp. FL2044]|nr:ribonuclease H-like protein [Xylariomycetidae sp. FL2044]